MTRPRTKKFVLRADVQYDLVQLFGTLPNAYARLGLDKQSLISMQTFYMGVKGHGLTEFQRDMIQERWRVWCAAYGKPNTRTASRESDPWSIDDDYFSSQSTMGLTAAEEELDRIAKKRRDLEMRERALTALTQQPPQRGEEDAEGITETDQTG